MSKNIQSEIQVALHFSSLFLITILSYFRFISFPPLLLKLTIPTYNYTRPSTKSLIDSQRNTLRSQFKSLLDRKWYALPVHTPLHRFSYGNASFNSPFVWTIQLVGMHITNGGEGRWSRRWKGWNLYGLALCNALRRDVTEASRAAKG